MLTLHENTCLHPPQSSLLLFCRWESSFTSAVLTLNLTDRRRIVFSVLLIGLHILNFFSNVTTSHVEDTGSDGMMGVVLFTIMQ